MNDECYDDCNVAAKSAASEHVMWMLYLGSCRL